MSNYPDNHFFSPFLCFVNNDVEKTYLVKQLFFLNMNFFNKFGMISTVQMGFFFVPTEKNFLRLYLFLFIYIMNT